MNSRKAHLTLLALEVRTRIRHYLDADPAKAANLTVPDLYQVASGHLPLKDWQVVALATRMRINTELAS